MRQLRRPQTRLSPLPHRTPRPQQRALVPVLAVALAAVLLIPIVVSMPSSSSAQSSPIIDDLVATPAATPVNVALSVENRLDLARNAEPVTTGVPLARGQLSDASQLWVEDTTTGQPTPAQFTVLSRWNGTAADTSRSIKWVLVDIQANVAASATANYVLRSGSNNPAPATPIRVDDSAGHLSVDTGPLQFRVPKSSFGSFFDGIWLDNNNDGAHETVVAEPGTGQGIVITRADGTQYRTTDDTSPQSVEIETAGPLHTVIKLTGRHTTNTGNGVCVFEGNTCGRDQFNYLDYTVRIHAYAGQPYVRVFYSLTNPERFAQGFYNQGGEKLFHQWDSFSLEFDLANATNTVGYVLGAEAPDDHEYPGNKAAASGAGNPTITGTLSATSTSTSNSTVELYQDSSGVDDWGDSDDGKWGTTFQGYRSYQNGTQADQGLQASGWATASSDGWTFGIGLRHFWQNFPKGLRLAADGNVALDLWPARSRDLHRFAGGRQKTHELVLGGWKPNQAATVAETMRAALDPMHLLADESHYSDTMALGLEPTLPADGDPDFDYFKATGQSAITGGQDVWSERFREDLYGWRNWGDAYRGGWKDVRYFGNNEFDLSYVNMANYLNSPGQDRRFFDVAESQARHLYDIDAYHTGEDAIAYSWGIHKHDASGTVDHSRSPLLSHYWIRGTLHYYLLTGDRYALDAATQTGVQLDNLIDDTTGEILFHGESRAQAWALLGLTELFETTGEGRYLQMAQQLAAAEFVDEQGLAGAQYPCPDLDWEGDAGVVAKSNVAIWQNGYVAESVGRYALVARLAGQADQAAETALVRLLNAITDCGWATQSNGLFDSGDTNRDNEIYGQRYEELALDRFRSDGSYNIAFAVNQVLTDGFAYGYIFSGDPDFLDMADRTWKWTMGPETMPGQPNPLARYDTTSTAAKSYGFRQRFGHSYLWLLQYVDDNGNPPPPPSTTTTQPNTTTTQPDTTTTQPNTTTTQLNTTTTQPPGNVCDQLRLDFEASDQLARLTPHKAGFGSPSLIAGNGSSVLAVDANNVNRSYLLTSPNGELSGDAITMASQVRMAYYGASNPIGSAHGLILKTLPDPTADDPELFDGYVVTAFADRTGIRLRVGVAADANSGFTNYGFRNPSHGHASYGDHLLFEQTLISDGQPHELGYWNLEAKLAQRNGNVEIDATLTNPSGRSETVAWVDDGANAYTGAGRTGVTSRGVWSLQSRFDNLDVTTATGAGDCGDGGGGGGDGGGGAGTTYSFDFDTTGSAEQFINLLDPGRGPTIVNHDGSNKLAIRSNNTSRPHLLIDEDDALVSGSEVSMALDARMSYYGSRTYGPVGSAHGLLLKTIPSEEAPSPSYIVSAQPKEDAITVWVGAVKDSSPGSVAYRFLGPTDGHTSADHHEWFPQRMKTNNRQQELGYWRLSASLTVVDGAVVDGAEVDGDTVDGDTVRIDFTLQAPDGSQRTGTWTDDGTHAHTGAGNVGLVNQGVWSIENRYDNLVVTVR